MAEFTKQMDDCNAVCPYCGDSYQVEAESYSEDQAEETCGACGNKYWLVTDFSVSHTTTPDCELNGFKHVWEMIELSNGRKHEFCSKCDQCRPLVCSTTMNRRGYG